MIPSYVLAPVGGSAPRLCLGRPWPACTFILCAWLQEQAPEGARIKYHPASSRAFLRAKCFAIPFCCLSLTDVKEKIITQALMPKGKLRQASQVHLTHKSRLKWTPSEPQSYRFVFDYSFPQTSQRNLAHWHLSNSL